MTLLPVSQGLPIHYYSSWCYCGFSWHLTVDLGIGGLVHILLRVPQHWECSKLLLHATITLSNLTIFLKNAKTQLGFVWTASTFLETFHLLWRCNFRQDNILLPGMPNLRFLQNSFVSVGFFRAVQGAGGLKRKELSSFSLPMMRFPP